jgi:hypothetical protein
MGEALTPILFVVLMSGAAFIFIWRSKAARKQIAGQYAHSKAGALAQRLGLTLVRGNPETNLQFADKGGVEHQHTDVLLSGTPHGVPTEIVYFRKAKDATSVGSALLGRSVTEVTWDCRIAARIETHVGRFQIRLKKPAQYLDASNYFDTELPLASFGVPELDAVLLLEADDPSIGPKLASIVGPLTTMPYVHVVGERGHVSFDMAHCQNALYGTGLATSYGFHFVEPLVHLLASAVCVLEGRSLPAQAPVAARAA